MYRGLQIYKITRFITLCDNWTTSSYLHKMKKIRTLLKTVRIHTKIIGMEFGFEKCAMLIMKCEKRQITDKIELLNQERIRKFGEKENYKYFEILGNARGVVRVIKNTDSNKTKAFHIRTININFLSQKEKVGNPFSTRYWLIIFSR